MKLTLNDIVRSLIWLIIWGSVYRISGMAMKIIIGQLNEDDPTAKYKMRIFHILIFTIMATLIFSAKSIILSYFQ